MNHAKLKLCAAMIVGVCLGACGMKLQDVVSVNGGMKLQNVVSVNCPCVYNDNITLPVEAFGAHWRVKNFRRNVKFPDGLVEAFSRALAIADMIHNLGRTAVISFAPRSYVVTSAILTTSRVSIVGSGHTTLDTAR